MLRIFLKDIEEYYYIQTQARKHKLLIKKDGHTDVDEYNVGCIASLCQQNKSDGREDFFEFLTDYNKDDEKTCYSRVGL
jgi:hypothetical protein